MTRGIVLHEEDLPTLDVLGEAFQQDPHTAIAAARASSRFAFSRRGIEVLAHQDILTLLKDDRLGSQSHTTYEAYGAGQMLRDFAAEGLLVGMQGERHSRIRRVFLAAFRARMVEQERGLMRDVASRLADHMLVTGAHHDFVSAFTSPYPMEVLCRILGIPAEGMPEFSAAATELHLLAQVPLAPGLPRVESALRKLWEYCSTLIAERRAHPRGDTISALIEAQQTHGKLSDSELIWNMVNLIFAGQDTTRYQLASSVRAIIDVPGLWDRLANEPEIIPGVVEESLRWYPVVNFVVRIPAEDVIFGGVEMRAGRRVILNFQAASRDPERFDDPFTFTPRPPGRHPQSFDIPFGLATHFCLGAALARAEIQEALAVLSQRFASIDPTGAPQMTAPASMLYGPEAMPILTATR